MKKQSSSGPSLLESFIRVTQIFKQNMRTGSNCEEGGQSCSWLRVCGHPWILPACQKILTQQLCPFTSDDVITHNLCNSRLKVEYIYKRELLLC